MLLVNCEIDLISTWSEKYYVKVNPIDDQEPTFIITDTKIYVPVVTFSTFLLVIHIFYLVNSCFALSLENNAQQTNHQQYFLGTVEINDYNVMISGKAFFNQPMKNDLRTCDNIQKMATGQRGN